MSPFAREIIEDQTLKLCITPPGISDIARQLRPELLLISMLLLRYHISSGMYEVPHYAFNYYAAETLLEKPVGENAGNILLVGWMGGT